VVIVLGDHGEAHGRGPRAWDWGHGGQVFEDGVHVPFVILHPSLGSSSVATPCTHNDVFPTLLDLIGAEIPAGLSGRSLARRVTPAPLFMHSIIWWPLAIRAGDYKLIMPSPSAPSGLFDIRTDPEESINLSYNEPDLARVLRSALLRWHSERFREDPTFGYREPGMQNLMGGGLLRSLEWSTPPTSMPQSRPSR
jgi:arylsulfatase A-like enzyme